MRKITNGAWFVDLPGVLGVGFTRAAFFSTRDTKDFRVDTNCATLRVQQWFHDCGLGCSLNGSKIDLFAEGARPNGSSPDGKNPFAIPADFFRFPLFLFLVVEDEERALL